MKTYEHQHPHFFVIDGFDEKLLKIHTPELRPDAFDGHGMDQGHWWAKSASVSTCSSGAAGW